MNRLAGLLLALFFTAPIFGNDIADDIFTNEAQTRRPANDRDFEIALGLHGCAGSLIAPNIGLSAAHCRKGGGLQSGMALKNKSGDDGRITRTLEIGSVSTYDYWIFEIQWSGNNTPHGMRVVPYIQTSASDLRVGANEVADKIYTLGFPQDIARGRLIHSWGYGKTEGNDGRIVNNISLINGNSGGGIWREKDDMIVSIVSGGPHGFGQPGWNNNDWNDRRHFNFGPALWKVYERSRVLKDLFPNGQNRFKNFLPELESFFGSLVALH